MDTSTAKLFEAHLSARNKKGLQGLLNSGIIFHIFPLTQSRLQQTTFINIFSLFVRENKT